MPIAIKNSIIDISSEETTKELAKQLSNYLKGGEIIFLYGEMGVGKTTFVKYLINQFQIKKNIQTTEVTSPTFNLLNDYEVNDLVIKHYDLFRLKDKSEITNLEAGGDACMVRFETRSLDTNSDSVNSSFRFCVDSLVNAGGTAHERGLSLDIESADKVALDVFANVI